MSRKSPEALRIYFSGPRVLKFLESNRLTVHESRIIEKAMATARTANPDLGLLEKADAIIRKIEHPESAESEQSPRRETIPPAEGSLAQLSREMSETESFEPDRHTFLGWLIWRWKWENFYAPIITLGIILLLYFVATHSVWVKNQIRSSDTFLSCYRYNEAARVCRMVRKRLPADSEELLSHLEKIPDYKARQGYWLRGGSVYFPDSGKVQPKDKYLHWTLCVE